MSFVIRDVGKSHVLVVQWRRRNVQKKLDAQPNHKSECHAHAVISNQSFALAVFKFHLSLNFVPATFLVRYYLVWLWFRGLSLHQFSLSTIDDCILHKKKAVAVLTRSCRSELTCLFLLFYFQCLWLDSHSVYGKPWLGLLFRF